MIGTMHRKAHITYLDELARTLLTNTATKITVTAKHTSICNEDEFILFVCLNPSKVVKNNLNSFLCVFYF